MDGVLTLFCGFIASIAMSLVFWLFRVLGLSSFSLEAMLGQMLTGHANGGLAWYAGFLLHLLTGGLLAFIYRTMFLFTGVKSWLFGALIGLGQWCVVGILIGLLPVGYFAANFGAGAIVSLLLVHIVYGAVVGTLLPLQPEELLAKSPLADSLGQGHTYFEGFKFKFKS